MKTTFSGKVWRFGDNIDTDLLAPGPYMKSPLTEMAQHCLEAIDENFAKSVQHGDILVAGIGFGIGSSREQAAQVLIELGIKAVVAESFARIFYRNALNLGLPVIECPDLSPIKDNDRLQIDITTGIITNLSDGSQLQGSAIPSQLMAIVEAGGLMPYLTAKHGNS
ncbi:3-isopropylmalate dehydratase [Paraferrimonas sp. SM1919]|uniref:LeuD/DmdB family oxidoreductase small subunit n=1 Tax=Paraferrimonas sp. SM1919 TaxID=2662263 RepID=UPI0013D1FA7B|nr:3-isopropylmalate dehydratase [Paraferrimonas sp. SM1919]